jgi:hypothetical protein
MAVKRFAVSPDPSASITRESGSRRLRDVPWGWIALSATILSALGYALQTLLDYVHLPDDVTRLVFFGFFEWDGILALITGCIAVAVGRKRNDWTFRLGLVAIGYVVMAQTIQILWD